MATQHETSPRPRTRSRLSFGSHRSSGSFSRAEMAEAAKEKASRRMTSKADPTMAINEAQPVVQALEKPTLESLRSMQHRDVHGNVITDPDRSNPTRPRFERPLDTIRSFEAAIDGSYTRRFSRQSRAFDDIQSRRSSYHPVMTNGNGFHQQRPYGERSSTYGGRISASRPESYVDPYGNGYRQSPAPLNPRRFGPRNHSDPALYGSNSNYSPQNHNYQQSYDTATTASGSGGSHGTEPWSSSTDPSSENSSVDRFHQPPKPDLAETYGFSGFGGGPQFQGPILEEYGGHGPTYGQPGYGQDVNGGRYAYQGNDVAPPPPPHLSPREKPNGPPATNGTLRKNMAPPRPPLKQQSESGEKRKSWLKRRFSRNS